MLLDRKFNEDSKNVLKTVIFSLQVGFTVFQTVFLAIQITRRVSEIYYSYFNNYHV